MSAAISMGRNARLTEFPEDVAQSLERLVIMELRSDDARRFDRAAKLCQHMHRIAVMYDEAGIEAEPWVNDDPLALPPTAELGSPETYGAKIIREILSIAPAIMRQKEASPDRLMSMLADARRDGMTDIAAMLKRKLAASLDEEVDAGDSEQPIQQKKTMRDLVNELLPEDTKNGAEAAS